MRPLIPPAKRGLQAALSVKIEEFVFVYETLA
jgi:hypothetical protein